MKKRSLLRIAAVFLGTLLIGLSSSGASRSSLSEVPPSVWISQFDSSRLPFSFEQLISYFDDVFQKPGYRIRDNVYVYVEDTFPNEFADISVSTISSKIAVTLVANGNWGVNYIREFFEAPFFFRSESGHLFDLLDEGPGTHAATLERFHVKIIVFEARNRVVIKAEFAPSKEPAPPMANFWPKSDKSFWSERAKE